MYIATMKSSGSGGLCISFFQRDTFELFNNGLVIKLTLVKYYLMSCLLSHHLSTLDNEKLPCCSILS
jgi:hypothetical protein